MNDDAIECRLEPTSDGEWADVYAQAGPNFPSYADEQFIGDAPLKFLRKRAKIEGDRTSLSMKTFALVRRLSRMGWPTGRSKKRRRGR